MKEHLLKRFRWVVGTLVAWLGAWLLLGIRAIPNLTRNPHPFVQGAKLKGPLLQGVISWSLGTLLAYTLAGLLLTLLARVALVPLSRGAKVNPGFREGMWTGLGSLLGFHAFLYLQVPTALDALPWLRVWPIGLVLLLMFGSAFMAMSQASRGIQLSHPWLRAFGAVLFVGLPMLVPHDIFRAWMTGSSNLSPTAPRVLLIGVDALRQDTLESIRPDWAAPGGCTPIAAVPATRKAWLSLYGTDPDLGINAVVMPERSEFSHPERMKLLVEAEQRGIRTAFVINDSLTPAFSLQPNRFASAVEPDGGWKYWFTLSYATCWPVYSWFQNYFSFVETTNTWCDSKAYYRDVSREIRRNHFVSAHDCRLHPPVTLNLWELQQFDPWRWVFQSARAYHTYATYDEAFNNKSHVTWRSDAKRHYEIRARNVICVIAPAMETWTRDFPNLSGLLLSDHGEDFAAIVKGKTLLSHHPGMHGYLADADTLRIPLHPFGQTRYSTLTKDHVFSWFDLRDGLLQWLRTQQPLALIGRQEGWVVQFPTIDSRDFTSPGPGTAAGSDSNEDQGIRISEIAKALYMFPNGTWFIDDQDMARFKNRKKSTALVSHGQMITFNPEGNNRYARNVFHGTEVIAGSVVTQEEMDREIAAFKGARPSPLADLTH